MLASSYRLGCVGGEGKENPLTSAPKRVSHKASQPPLKPVCPVTSTRLPCQNAEFMGNNPAVYHVRSNLQRANVKHWNVASTVAGDPFLDHRVIQSEET